MVPVEQDPAPAQVDEMAQDLEALASPTRLRLLWALRSPKKASAVRVPASQARDGLPKDRALSRPAVVQHLDVLEDAGLVQPLDATQGSRYVVDHQRVFRLLKDLGRLAEIEPLVDVDVDETIHATAAPKGGLPDGPKFVSADGPSAGEAFALEGKGPWLLGRSREADVALDWDPHVSDKHARIHRDEDGAFVLEALSEATNPVQLNFEPVARGKREPLIAGAVVTAGASTLVFQLV